MNLLHLDTSINGTQSASRRVSSAIVAHLRGNYPRLQVTYRDLAAQPLMHLSAEHLAAIQGRAPQTAAVKDDLAVGQAMLEEFLSADLVVIGAPMYNFTVPTQLKAWIDRIVVAGRTFRYGPQGPEGLAGGRRVVVAVSRGGFYGQDSPTAAFEHLETYLRVIFRFVGVTELQIIVAEGLLVSAEQREKALAAALKAATELYAA
jgi:FMN-dependent NADH-azoreductase